MLYISNIQKIWSYWVYLQKMCIWFAVLCCAVVIVLVTVDSWYTFINGRKWTYTTQWLATLLGKIHHALRNETHPIHALSCYMQYELRYWCQWECFTKIPISDYETLLSKGGVDSFRISSLKTMAVEIYKILNGMDPKYLSALFCKASTPYNLRDDNKLIQPLKGTTTYGIKSLAYYGTHLWNSLPHDIKGALTLNNFKTLLRKWVGPICGCSVCEMII